MMDKLPIAGELIQKIASEAGVPPAGRASIREIVHLVNLVEKATGIKYIRMEFGVPGLKAPEIATHAEIEALKKGVSSIYPPIEGVADLKNETSRFIKLFLDVDVKAEGCIPTCGSMQGSCAGFLTVNRTDRTKEGTLFIDPGFPVHKQQCHVLGHDFQSFDIYDFRGKKLEAKLRSYLDTGKISSMLYSNPNNPSWICLNEEELALIGKLADEYDVVVLEDLAYFGMDFRRDISKPGMAPFQPTVAKYTGNYILLISASKIFSFAGQRLAMMAVSDKLFNKRYPDLLRYFNSDVLGHTIIYGALYALSAGASHSAQIALAALFKAVNDGVHNPFEAIKAYGENAHAMKDLFTKYGFRIVYDMDLNEPIADGFYFTISYPGFSGPALLDELVRYGISAITLGITGSTRTEGLRACVSQFKTADIPVLEERLKLFHKDHS
ncbi:MAG TPA: pyridoxal phosphate-dependent aminotransferase [Bacteroidales bacterium]|nr:pyridoxal phosphate-dependent aminotransferase [Bacteroidales bacterium]